MASPLSNSVAFPHISSDLGLDPADKKGYKSMLLLLPSIAGLAGATLRVPNSFMMSVTGGKVFPSPTYVKILFSVYSTCLHRFYAMRWWVLSHA